MHAARAVALVLLTACAPPPPPWSTDAGTARADAGTPGPCEALPSVVETGTGITVFTPLADAQDVTFEAGPQGGHHIWVSLRARGFQQTRTTTQVRVSDVVNDAARLVVERSVTFPLQREEGGFCVVTGLRMQLDENPQEDLTALIGHTLRVDSLLTDVAGHQAEDSVTLVLRAPQDFVPDAGP